MPYRLEPSVVGLLKVERNSLTNQVLAILRDSIISGKLKPGTRLVESELADRFGVSRLPVRDALLQLEAVGFVTCGAHGRQVVELSELDIQQLYRVRYTLEPVAVELAATQRTPERNAALRAKLEEMRQALSRHDVMAFSNRDLEMHYLIWQQADDPHLLKVLNSVIGPLYMYLAKYAEELDWRETLRAHESLAEAICRGDAKAAIAITQHHLEDAARRSQMAVAERKEV